MIVISDTTPVISLLKSGRLELLQRLYGKVLVPRAVYRELTENPTYQKEADIVKKADFLAVEEVRNVKSVNRLRSVSGLDAGESEALVLYEEQKAAFLLMDERKGRKVAKQLHVKHIGTAGVLMLAYDRGLILAEEVKACVDAMLLNKIRLDRKVCNTIMAYVGLEEIY